MNQQVETASAENSLEINRLGSRSREFLIENDPVIKQIQTALHPLIFTASANSEAIVVEGDPLALKLVSKVMNGMIEALSEGNSLGRSSADAIIAKALDFALKHELTRHLDGLLHPVRPMSMSQSAFLERLLSRNEKLLFGIGPTGTGKTHLAIAAALNQLSTSQVSRIVVSRPHIVLQGEIVTPDIRSDMELDAQFEYLEDIFIDLIGYQGFRNLLKDRKLELIPLGHLRGRTFNDSFIIIDEAQNMTIKKMRMAVTRIGRGSRMIVTGDPSQADLLGDEPSGLTHILDLLKGSEIATIHQFDETQIVRNGIVAQLEQLYSKEAALNPSVAA